MKRLDKVFSSLVLILYKYISLVSEIVAFITILEEPESSLIKQYIALMKTENINLSFTKDGIAEIASFAFKMNEEVENIGARRLHTLIEKILEDLSYNASEMEKGTKIKIDKKYVIEHIGDLNKKIDISKFIL